MPTFNGQTVDLHEDFEDSLSGSWTETDPDVNINPGDTDAKKNGAAGASFNFRGSSAGGDAAYLGYDIGSVVTEVSVGFWLKLPSSTSSYDHRIFALNQTVTNMTSQEAYISAIKSGSTYYIVIYGSAGAGDYNVVSPDTWYWVTCKMIKGGTCTLSIYDEAHSELTSSDTVTGNNTSNTDSLVIGISGTTDENVEIWFDDFVADWTDATFPLWGWSTDTDPITWTPHVGKVMVFG